MRILYTRSRNSHLKSSDMAPYLSKDIATARFEFYGKTLSGQKEQEPRWERVMGVINGSIGEQLGKLYVDKYFCILVFERNTICI